MARRRNKSFRTKKKEPEIIEASDHNSPSDSKRNSIEKKDKQNKFATKTKVSKLITSAYPTASTILISEISSDNVTDNGKKYSTLPQVDEMYRFKTITAS